MAVQRSCGWLASFSALLFSCLSSVAADRVALVVGVDRYDHLPEEAQLSVAVSDARLIAKTLQSVDPAFEVTLLEDQTRLELGRALDTFIEQARGAECALVYFAGHGVEYHGENFLLSRDTSVSSISADVERMKRRMRNESLSLQALVDDLDATQAQVKVVIVDACRDNPLKAEDQTGTRSLVGAQGGLAAVTAPSGTLISYSADAGQKANDGLFTEVLVKQLATPGRTLMEVFAETRIEVRDRSTELAAQRLGVRHEPAEYVKLNPAALKFAFMKGKTENGVVPDRSEAMADLEAQIVALQATVEMLQQQGIENEALKAQLEKMEKSMAAETGSATPEMGTAVTTADIPPAPADKDPLVMKNREISTVYAQLAATEMAIAKEESEEAKRALQTRAAELTALLHVLSMELAELESSLQSNLNSFVMIPAGEFPYQDAGKVSLPEFWIGRYEVTIAEYEDFLEDIKANPEKEKRIRHPQQPEAKTDYVPEKWDEILASAKGSGLFFGAEIEMNFPVMGVDWWDANAFATWRGGRLPTEKEWEMASRGQSGNIFPWGDVLIGENLNSGWDQEASSGKEAGGVDGFKYWNPVDEMKSDQSWSGVFNMAGNVMEWTATWLPLPEAPDKLVPVKRGASFASTSDFELATRRAGKSAEERNFITGFRVAADTANPQILR